MINKKQTPAEVAKRLLRAADYAGYVSRYDLLRDKAHCVLHRVLTAHAGDAPARKGNTARPIADVDGLCAYYRDVLVQHCATFSLSVTGLHTPVRNHAGLSQHQVTLLFTFGICRIRIDIDAKTSEYESICEQSTTVQLDGEPPEAYLGDDPIGDDNTRYGSDIFANIGFDVFNELYNLGEDDIRDPDDPELAEDKRLYRLALTL